MKFIKKIIYLLFVGIGLIGICLSNKRVALYAMEECHHEYEVEIHEPTCVSMGYTTYSCVHCDKTFQDNYIEKKAHSYEEIVIAPTCVEQGYTIHFCTTCGYQYYDNYVEEEKHHFLDTIIEPTCTSIGYTVHQCQDCSYSYQDHYIEKLEHTYDRNVVEATCTTKGYTIYTCIDCGDTYQAEDVAEFGHEESIRIILPTCSSYGYTEHICKICEHRWISDVVKALGHDYEEEIIEATPTNTGYTLHRCKRCTHQYLSDFKIYSDEEPKKDDEIEKPPHEHQFQLFYMIDEETQMLFVQYRCSCHQSLHQELYVLLTNQEGITFSFVPEKDGTVDFTHYNGTYSITIVDKNGQILEQKEKITFGKAEEKPSPPKEDETKKDPDITNSPVVEDNSSSSENPSILTENVPKKKSALPITLMLIIFMLGIGATITYIIIYKRKQNK